jgi:AcrR family transcriptional regulator
LEPQPASDLLVSDDSRPRRGRPRSASADRAIIDAAATLLCEVGYRALCMETVAARAGISKATLYRRYKDKEALITATILITSGTPPRDMPLPAGSARESLTFMLKTAAIAIASPLWLPILGAMFSEGPRSGGLSRAMRNQILDPSAEIVGRLVQAGIDQGELRPTVSPVVVNDVLFGSLLARSMLGEAITDEWIDAVVASVWEGFGAASEPCGEPTDDPGASGRASSC